MANIKSQIKRNRQNEKRRVRNRNYRGAARTAVNIARSAFDTSAPDTKEAVMAAVSALDRAAEKGVIHANNAARRKGRLMRRLYALNAPARPVMASTPQGEKPAKVEAKAEAEAVSIEEPKGKKIAPTSSPKGKRTAEPKKTGPAKKAAVRKSAAKAPARKKASKK